MPAIINSNIASLNAQRNVATSQSSLSISMQRLSSGMRVNSAKDDAAGLAIAERMSSQVRGMNVAVRNANDGISLAQTAEGALGKVADSLQRMRELGVQARNATNTTQDLDSIGKEFKELGSEIQRVLGGTTFNGTAILGAGAGAKDFQIGANTTANDVVTVTTTDMTGNGDITAVTGDAIDNTKTAADLKTTIDQIDTAINTVSSERATLGAAQNRFEAVISNLMVSVENQSASRSRILDADYATETANLSRSQILQQAGTAMIAQANQMPQQVLSLLR
ncbi:flagellin FliC [Paucibacter sp. DJ1R-11]|uniref:flagellin N-terminal helical domain-containing protein n=1 Tax=unclassified Roseateles TaxID=2626991 RepID=UPI0021E466BA|nr:MULTISPECIES: flagellin [unclassified Roseateles]MCV2366243.1 flagellin FliC [Paucibacter sp. DJ1R-11]MCV2423298.1 flagellin FliC [Paucibacter sp. DJ4R-1]MCV2441483.1 flagellin FliC [Paucibacter sp. DJ2R-2]